MGWFTDWLDKDKSEKESDQCKELPVKNIDSSSILNNLFKNSVPYLGGLLGSYYDYKDTVWFKTKNGDIYSAEADLFTKYRGKSPEWEVYRKGGTNKVKDVCFDGITHLNSKENHQAFLKDVKEWIESSDGVFFIKGEKILRIDNVTTVWKNNDSDWFAAYVEGFLFRGNPQLKLRTISETHDYSKLKIVVDELVRMKLTGDVEILEKGCERSILLKEYFDHSWIDIGLKGTLFVQDLDTHEATSWSDVDVKREKLSSLVKSISDILSYESGVELKPHEAALLKDVKHYVNKAKELIEG